MYIYIYIHIYIYIFVYVLYFLRAHHSYEISLPRLYFGIFIFSLPVFIFVGVLFKLFINCMSCFNGLQSINKQTLTNRAKKTLTNGMNDPHVHVLTVLSI